MASVIKEQQEVGWLADEYAVEHDNIDTVLAGPRALPKIITGIVMPQIAELSRNGNVTVLELFAGKGPVSREIASQLNRLQRRSGGDHIGMTLTMADIRKDDPTIDSPELAEFKKNGGTVRFHSGVDISRQDELIALSDRPDIVVTTNGFYTLGTSTNTAQMYSENEVRQRATEYLDTLHSMLSEGGKIVLCEPFKNPRTTSFLKALFGFLGKEIGYQMSELKQEKRLKSVRALAKIAGNFGSVAKTLRHNKSLIERTTLLTVTDFIDLAGSAGYQAEVIKDINYYGASTTMILHKIEKN